MFKVIKEGDISFYAPVEKKISKSLPVFYNPIMKLNRDISILLLNALNNKNMQIALPLAGTGIRGVRFLKELNEDIIENISFNDYNSDATKLIKKNLKQNKMSEKFEINNEDANDFLLGSNGFDYIDVDPFGSPNLFLDSSVKRLSRRGILAVTATDTASLCGTYPKVCMRRYWAKPVRDELMYEVGLRILIRKVQLIGAQFDKALIPIFSYFRHHYFRIFFVCNKGKTHVDNMLKKHGEFNQAGPLWLGDLWDEKLVTKMNEINKFDEHEKFLSIIKEESKIHTVGYYDLHSLSKIKKLESIPKTQVIFDKILKKGLVCSRTHFKDTALRTNITIEEFKKII
jgi:tRNA (guanine26-N2/guanine27-N2)-dimethyltransferase